VSQGHWLKGWNDKHERVVLYVTTAGQRYAWEPRSEPGSSWEPVDCGYGTSRPSHHERPLVYDAPEELVAWARGGP